MTLKTDGIIQTLTSRMGTGGGNTHLVFVQGLDTYNQQLTGDKAKTLLAGHIDPDGVPCVIFNMLQDAVPNDKVSPCLQHQKWVVRRVTPTECARLQGMPDWWCKDIKHSDSAEYKLWGNGMALPCTLYIMQGLARVNRKQMLTKLEVRC